MKYIFLLLTLLLAPSVWANHALACHTTEAVNDEFCKQMKERRVIIPAPRFDKVECVSGCKHPEQTYCEIQLEAAMRAMEPYMHDAQFFLYGPSYTGNWPDPVWHFEKNVTEIDTKKYVERKELWQSVKRDCWRQP